MKRARLIEILAVVVMTLAACGHTDSSSSGAPPPPATPPADAAPSLADSCKAICTRNVSCSGLTGAEAASKQADCVQVCVGQASGDPLAAEVVPQVMASVAAKC